MSFSWTYLTRRNLFQNYRDYIAVGIIVTGVTGKWAQHIALQRDSTFVMQQVYTHDESDIAFREITNKTDGAVKREHAMRYAEKIKKLRAEKEREAALDAYNYLNVQKVEL